MFSGAVGGAGAMLLEKVLSDNLTESQKGAYQIAAGFLTAAIFKKGYAGAGMSAIGISKLIDLLLDQGFNEDLMVKICHQNWINLIDRIL